MKEYLQAYRIAVAKKSMRVITLRFAVFMDVLQIPFACIPYMYTLRKRTNSSCRVANTILYVDDLVLRLSHLKFFDFFSSC